MYCLLAGPSSLDLADLLQEVAPVDREAQKGAQSDTGDVCQEVQPVARTGRRAVRLSQFDESAQDDGQDDGADTELRVVDVRVAAQVLNPKARREHEIHQDVHPLVDEGDVVHFSFRDRQKACQQDCHDEQPRHGVA
mgnify:CR=1 FL=1